MKKIYKSYFIVKFVKAGIYLSSLALTINYAIADGFRDFANTSRRLQEQEEMEVRRDIIIAAIVIIAIIIIIWMIAKKKKKSKELKKIDENSNLPVLNDNEGEFVFNFKENTANNTITNTEEYSKLKLMTKEEVTNEVGKKSYFSDDNTIVARLNYISGINGFDEFLEQKNNKNLEYIIHIKEYPNGIAIKLVYNFSEQVVALNYNKIKKVCIKNHEKYSTLNIETKSEPIILKIDNNDVYLVKEFFGNIK